MKLSSRTRIRKNETNFIIQNIKNKNNLLVIGEKGVGKTTIIKQSSKKILSIDLMITNKKNLYNQLSLKGKLFLINELLIKNFIKILSICISFGLLIWTLLQNNSSNNLLNIFFGLLLMFFWLFFWLIIFSMTKILKFNKNLNLHFHEMNFVKTNKEKVFEIIWKIFSIYKNHLLIFESDDDFPEDLKYKFKLSEISIRISDNKMFLIETLFYKLKQTLNDSRTKNLELKNKILNELVNHTKIHENIIYKLFTLLSYRKIENITQNFKETYLFLKQEINFLDFLLMKFLKIKYSNLYKMFKDDNEYDIFKPKKDVLSEEENIKKDNFLQEVEKIYERGIKIYIQKHFEGYYADLAPKDNFYSVFNKKYRNSYLSNVDYSYLERNLIKYFKEKPIKFLLFLIKNNIEEIEILKLLSDEEIIKFYNHIEKESWENLFPIFIKQNTFLYKNIFNNLRLAIINSRDDKEKFYNSLPIKFKYYFFSAYNVSLLPNDSDKFKKKYLPFSIKKMPKKLFFNSHKLDSQTILFDSKEYFKNIINKKNILLILQYFQSSSEYYISGGSNENYHRFFFIKNEYSDEENAFLIKCFDECNEKILFHNKWKIKKTNPKNKEWIELTKKELEKFRMLIQK